MGKNLIPSPTTDELSKMTHEELEEYAKLRVHQYVIGRTKNAPAARLINELWRRYNPGTSGLFRQEHPNG